MRYQGKITKWKDDQGFGFITPKSGGQQVFVHIKSFSNRHRRPVGNEIVTYEVKNDPKCRSQAVTVEFVGERLPPVTSSESRCNLSLILVGGFFLIMVALVFAGKLPAVLLGLYLVASGVTFVAYALDKSPARNDQWRIQESTLHLFALVGGWPGAFAAQNMLRHKSKKQSFQIVFWTTVFLNCGALCWLFSTSGTEFLLSILGAA